MDLRLPSSMTALVNVRFHYDEENRKLSGEVELQLLDELMGNADRLGPELQEILVKFAQTLSRASKAPQEKAG